MREGNHLCAQSNGPGDRLSKGGTDPRTHFARQLRRCHASGTLHAPKGSDPNAMKPKSVCLDCTACRLFRFNRRCIGGLFQLCICSLRLSGRTYTRPRCQPLEGRSCNANPGCGWAHDPSRSAQHIFHACGWLAAKRCKLGLLGIGKARHWVALSQTGPVGDRWYMFRGTKSPPAPPSHFWRSGRGSHFGAAVCRPDARRSPVHGVRPADLPQPSASQ